MQYRRRDSLVRIYELSKRFIDQLIKEMEEMERYPEDTVLRGRGYVLVEEDAFRDYLKWRMALHKKFIRHYLPEYKRAETPEKIYMRGVETR